MDKYSDETLPQWLKWSQSLHALARNGIAYTQNHFDRERFLEIQNIAAEITAKYTDVDFETIRDVYDDQAGYMTPKIDVRGVVFNEGKILLVQERADHCRWTLPGGWADVQDSPSHAVEREVYEEAGFVVHTTKLLMLHDRNKHGHTPSLFHIYKLFFRCEMVGGAATSSIETAEIAFFAEDEIPPLSLGRTTPEQIGRIFEHYRNPGLPTDFD